MFCDLHMHSTASDGTDAPAVLPRLAKDAGLAAIALTDHDTTAGLAECAAAAKKLRIGFLSGIELSANPLLDVSTGTEGDAVSGGSGGAPTPRGTLHILGYGVRHDSDSLATVQRWLFEARAQRNPAMIEKLNELGVAIAYDEVLEAADATADPASIVGRPHIAQVLVRKGYVKSVHEAFSRYIGQGAAAYIRKDRLSAADAIRAIHDAGGLAFLAHPVQLGLADHDAIEHFAVRLQQLGLDGIETRHSDHSPADVDAFEQTAAHLGLLASGGSDYHGSRKAIALGGVRVAFEVYQRILEAVDRA
jgi:hypothetical protein